VREVILQATINREWLLVPNIIAPHDNEVQQYVHNQVQPEVHIIDRVVRHVVLRIADRLRVRVQGARIRGQLPQVEVIVHQQEVVQLIEVQVQQEVVLRVTAGVVVGVPVGVQEVLPEVLQVQVEVVLEDVNS